MKGVYNSENKVTFMTHFYVFLTSFCFLLELVMGRTTTVAVSVCSSETDENGLWPSTNVNEESLLPCPEGSSGSASRKCDSNAEWHTVNFTTCKKYSLTALERNLTGDNSTCSVYLELVNELANSTLPTLLEFTGHLIQATQILVDLIENVRPLRTENCWNNTEEAVQLIKGLLTVASNLVDVEYLGLWKDVHMTWNEKESLELLWTLDHFSEDVLYYLIKNQDAPSNISYKDNNIQARFDDVDINEIGEAVYFPDDSSAVGINISRKLFENITYSCGKAGLSNILYDTLHLIIKDSNYAGLSSSYGSINSQILSTLLYPKITWTLPYPLFIEFQHLKKGSVATFAYIDYTQDSSLWTTEGCEVLVETTMSNSTVGRCFTTAADFALLVDFNATDQEESESSTKKFTLTANCIISVIIGLLFYLLIMALLYWINKKFESDWELVVECTLFTLFFKDLTFLAGITATNNLAACKAVAILLYYLNTSVYFWILCQAVLVYMKLMSVRTSDYTSVTIVHYCVAGWLAPLLLLAALAGIEYQSGENQWIRHCWFSMTSPIMYGFVGPLILVIGGTVIILCFTMYSYVKIRQTERKYRKNLKKIKPNAIAVAVVLPTLLLTNGLSLVSVNTEDNYSLDIIFSLIMSFNGIILFICYGLLNFQVQMIFRARFGHRSKAVGDTGQTANGHAPTSDLDSHVTQGELSSVVTTPRLQNGDTVDSDVATSEKSSAGNSKFGFLQKLKAGTSDVDLASTSKSTENSFPAKNKKKPDAKPKESNKEGKKISFLMRKTQNGKK